MGAAGSAPMRGERARVLGARRRNWCSVEPSETLGMRPRPRISQSLGREEGARGSRASTCSTSSWPDQMGVHLLWYQEKNWARSQASEKRMREAIIMHSSSGTLMVRGVQSSLGMCLHS